MKKIVCSIVIFIFLSNGFSFAEEAETVVDDKVAVSSVDDNGLMESDWPMHAHDLRHTGRSSSALDGNLPVLKWKFETYDEDPIYGSPVIDTNGTIFFGILSAYDNFFALNPDGSVKWQSKVNNALNFFQDSPALASDGTIYVGAWDHNFYALNSDGSLKWRFNVGNKIIWGSPSIADDGTVYFGTDNYLFALWSNGTLRWKFPTGGLIGSCPAIDSEGIVYFGSKDSYLYAVYPNGSLNWKFKVKDPIIASPAIGVDGTIYITSWDHKLYAVNPNGSLIWKFKTDASIQEGPAIGVDGVLYVATYDGSLYAVYPNGTLKWEYLNLAEDSFFASPVVDANSVIYIGGNMYDECFYAVNPDGSLRWKIQTNDGIEGTAAISGDGVIYFGNYAGELFACETIRNDIPGVPEIRGPVSGKIREVVTVQVRCIDPEGDDVQYWVDWGDGSNSGWIIPHSSGEWVNVSHTFVEQGDFSIRVKARDVHSLVDPVCRETDFVVHRLSVPRGKGVIDFVRDGFDLFLSLFIGDLWDVQDFLYKALFERTLL